MDAPEKERTAAAGVALSSEVARFEAGAMLRAGGNMASIGVLNEGHLHAALKDWYARPGDQVEVPVESYQVDLVRDGLLIEIQTGSFSNCARKLRDLVERHRVRLVHPIARERIIVRLPEGGRGAVRRRRSPKRLGFERVFEELVSIPELVAHENFELELVATREEEVREWVKRPRRQKYHWRVSERRLLEVLAMRLVTNPQELLELLPRTLPEPFDTAELAEAWQQPRSLAQQVTYCLRKAGALEETGRRGNARLYARRPMPAGRLAGQPT